MSRYDATGLIWLLNGQPMLALTDSMAAIQNPTSGSIAVYRKLTTGGNWPRDDRSAGRQWPDGGANRSGAM